MPPPGAIDPLDALQHVGSYLVVTALEPTLNAPLREGLRNRLGQSFLKRLRLPFPGPTRVRHRNVPVPDRQLFPHLGLRYAWHFA